MGSPGGAQATGDVGRAHEAFAVIHHGVELEKFGDRLTESIAPSIKGGDQLIFPGVVLVQIAE
ncbi:hypothetical protein D3C84_1319470 [compost metagenome]